VKQVNSSLKPSRLSNDGEYSDADSGMSLSSSGIVYSLFQAQFRSVVKCPVCHEESSSVEPFLFVSLPVSDVLFSVSATVVHSHPYHSVAKMSVNISSSATVKHLRHAIATAASIPANQVCYSITMCGFSLQCFDIVAWQQTQISACKILLQKSQMFVFGPSDLA